MASTLRKWSTSTMQVGCTAALLAVLAPDAVAAGGSLGCEGA